MKNIFKASEKQNSGRRRKGCRPLRIGLFSLIELLVVITIISMLAAMLLPALQKARDKARTINCAGNLKTHGIAMNSYISDFSGYTPAIYCTSGTWGLVLSNNSYLQAASSGVWSCPSAKRLPLFAGETLPQKGATYGMWCLDVVTNSCWHFTSSPRYISGTPGVAPFRPKDSLDIPLSPSRTTLISDSVINSPWRGLKVVENYYVWRNGANGGNSMNMVAVRHESGSRANQSFADGHVETLDTGRLNRLGWGLTAILRY